MSLFGRLRMWFGGGYSGPSVSFDQLGELLRAYESGRGRIVTTDPTLSRCVSLISQVVAQLIASPMLRVQDDDGRRVDTPVVRKLLAMIRRRPDGITPGYTYWQRAAFDYLFHGNLVQRVLRGVSGSVRAVARMEPREFSVQGDGMGVVRYHVRPPVHAGMTPYEVVVSPREIVHSMWPVPVDGDQYRGTSPVTILNEQLRIAGASDEYALQYFEGGPGGAIRTRTAIELERNYSEAQLKTWMETSLEASRKSRFPWFLLPGMKLRTAQEDAVDADQRQLRTGIVERISSLYGIPAPLLNINVTQWGSGIEQLAKLAYRYGFRQHADALLQPLGERLLRAGQWFAIDEKDLIRGDTQALAGLLSVLLQNGCIAPSQARQVAGFSADLTPEQTKEIEESGQGESKGAGDSGVPGDSGDIRGSPSLVPRNGTGPAAAIVAGLRRGADGPGQW